MTAAVLDRPGTLFADAGERGAAAAADSGERPAVEPAVARGRLTLEELLNSALNDARTNGSAECPVCHARMSYTRIENAAEASGETHDAFAAACGACGSRLS
jgi:hypothetical protein